MKIGFPKEEMQADKRVAILPHIVEKYKKLGAEILIEKGIGKCLFIEDEEFIEKGASVIESRKELLQKADLILRLFPPPKEEIALSKKGSSQVGFFHPFTRQDLIEELKKFHITAYSMELLPRSTIAQKMDALSSQANLAGYASVLLATNHLQKILPMMTTPAGTLFPAKVFIIGVGVAGLQAIATAKRLGARVSAFDTRPVVEEQVLSLGAKFIKVDLGKTSETKEGYAKALSKEQLEKQKEAMKEVCMDSDIVITTAQLLGKKAPLILTKDMVQSMKRGSVIVDLAAETGGNVEGSKMNEEVHIDGVTILAPEYPAGTVPLDASSLYAANLYNFIEHFWDKENKSFKPDPSDTIITSTLLTENGEMKNRLIHTFMEE